MSPADGRADRVVETEPWEIRSLDFLELPSGGVEVESDRVQLRANGVDTAYSLIRYDNLTPEALKKWTADQKSVDADTERRLPPNSLPTEEVFFGHQVKDGSYHCFAADRPNKQFTTPDTVEYIPFEDTEGDSYLFVSRAYGRWGCADEELEQLVAEAQLRERRNQAFAEAFERIVHSPAVCAFSLGAVGVGGEEVYEICNG